MQETEIFTWLGILFIIFGISFIFLPFLVKFLATPDTLEKIPPILLYVYKSNGFVFATSPILIIISLIFFLLSLARSGS